MLGGAPEKGVHISSYWGNPLPRPQGWVEVESSWFVWGLGCPLLSQERGERGRSAGEGSEHGEPGRAGQETSVDVTWE